MGMSKPLTRPAVLPADAVGFIRRRADKPERPALFLADGRLNTTYSPGDTVESLDALLRPHGFSVDAEGIVRRVG
jgi:hypothetical protein